MKILDKIHRLVLSILLLSFSTSILAASVDLYIVYASADKDIQKNIKKSMPSTLKIKSYNTSLLAMADYTGKQKTVSKLNSASLVVIVNKETLKLLGDPTFSNSIIVSSGDENDVAEINKLLPQ